MMQSWIRWTSLLLILGSTATAQDSLQLTDGRTITGPKMSPDDDGIIIHFENGDITIAKDQIKDTSVVDDAAVEASMSEKDRKKLKRGLVKFEGKWMSKKERRKRVAKRADEIKAKADDAVMHSQWGNRRHLESKHFKFEYTIDPEIMEEWADLMDAYYDAFSKYWGGLRRPQGFDKLQVKFFTNNDQFLTVSGVPRGVLGFFRFVPPLELNFFYERLDQELVRDVMFHEANHYLCWLMAPKYNHPNWIEEGLAEYYAASKWDPVKKKLTTGGLLEGRLAGVQQEILADEWVTFEDMMPYPNIPGNYYGWAWTFVHFMMHSKYEKRFKKMFINLPKAKGFETNRTNYGTWSMERHTPKAQKEILKKFLKVKDLEKLQKEWHAYIEQLEPASARGFYESGRIALRDNMPIKATGLYEKAIDMGFEEPAAHIGLANALQRKPKKNRSARVVDYKRAVEHYTKAVEMDPLNPLFRAGYARMLNRFAWASEKVDPRVARQRGLAQELADCIDGGIESYSTFLSLQWTVWEPDKSDDVAEEEGDQDK